MTLLNEGITHIEDLDVTAFIDAVRRIGQMQASEKLDGANLWFGLDEQGKLYTTRAGKREGSEKFYSESDYPYFAAYNGFRGTHAALQVKEKDIKTILSPGDTVEIEVLYGRQPNAVAYGLDGKNFIAFLRGVNGTPDVKVDQLIGSLNNSEVVVKTIIVDTSDGVNLERKALAQTFRFVGVQKINPELLKSVKVEKEVKALEKYLEEKSGVNDLTNYELMTTSLGSIPKEVRAEAKLVKERVLSAVKNNYKLTIKKALLDRFVSKVKPALGASDLSGDEDNGVEGVVLKDPGTGEQLKIVDKDGFTTINQFNFAVRNQIAGMVKTLDDSAPLESRGGITGQMKIRIAETLGNKDLAMGRTAKKIFNDNKGENPTQTLRNVAKTLNGAQDFKGVQRKVGAVVQATIDELGNMLAKFNKHKDSDDDTYRLRLKNGKAMGLSPEIVKRTLMTFAETRRNLTELLGKVQAAPSFDALVAVLYGRAAKQVHSTGDEDDQVDEALMPIGAPLFESRVFADVALYMNEPDAQHFLLSYIATVCMTALIFKAEDKRGLLLVKDKTNFLLKKFTDNMSQLNFWGYGLWNSDNMHVQKLFKPGVGSALARIVKKIPPQWWKDLHRELSYNAELDLNWNALMKTMYYLLQQAEGMSGFDRIKNIISDVFKYDTLSFDEKTKILPRVYFLGTQYVPNSPLIARVRSIQNQLLGAGDPDDDAPTPVAMAPGATVSKLLGEDGEIAPAAAADAGAEGYSSPAVSNAAKGSTQAGDIANHQTRIGDGKRQIVKRKRNPDIKFLKFKRPEPEDNQ